MTLERFPIHVIEVLGWYVYRLIDPRSKQTFYVGKGTGNRIFDHIKGLIETRDADFLSPKLETIKEIRDQGCDIEYVIHRHGMDENTAFEVEAALIEAYENLTNIQGGYANTDRGAMTAKEIVEKYSKEEANIEHKLIVIDVSRSFSRKESARTIERKNLLDSVRFMWALSKRRAEKCELVLAQRGGVIQGVFKPREWKEATRQNFPEFEAEISKYEHEGNKTKRIGFVGDEVSDPIILSRYKDKRVPANLRNAPQQPCRYVGI